MKQRSSHARATRHWLIPTSIFGITLATYLPSCNYPFQFDDLGNITKNFNIRSFDVWSGMLSYRRWLGEWVNTLIYQFDKFSPFYYRLTNIAIHLAAGALVYALVLWLGKQSDKTSFAHQQRGALATVTTALFLLHPVQSQTVSYAVQGKFEGLASLFALASLFCAVKALTHRRMVMRVVLFGSALITAFLGCGTKEIACMTPVLLLLTDWFFIARQSFSNLMKRISWHAIYTGSIGALMVHYMQPRFFIEALRFNIELQSNRGNVLTEHIDTLITPFQFCISQFKVVLHYLGMFIMPTHLSVDYDWKLSSSIFSADVILPFLLLASLVCIVLLPVVRKQMPIVSFGILWFFICMAPRSTIVPSQELAADYKTYLASFGWLLVLSFALLKGVEYLFKNARTSHMTPLAYYSFLLLTCGSLASRTYHRNLVWSSPIAFWSDVVEKAPNKARGYNNLGVEMVRAATRAKHEGRVGEAETLYAQAMKHYERAISLDDTYPDPWSNLSVCHTIRDDIDQAIMVAYKAIQLFPYYPEAYMNLGTQLLAKKDFEHAEMAFQNAIKCRGHYGKAYYNLARCYELQGKDDEAWSTLKQASEADFDNIPQCWLALGQLSFKMQKQDDAIAALEKYRQVDDGSHAGRWTMGAMYLANAYHIKKDFDKAAPLYHELTKMHPNDNRYWHNLAECFFEKEQYSNAQKCYTRAMACDTCEVQTYFRLAQSYEKTQQYDDAAQVISSVIHAKNSADLPDEVLTTCRNELMRINTAAVLAERQATNA